MAAAFRPVKVVVRASDLALAVATRETFQASARAVKDIALAIVVALFVDTDSQVHLAGIANVAIGAVAQLTRAVVSAAIDAGFGTLEVWIYDIRQILQAEFASRRARKFF